jgi:hypothetical protein
MEFQRILELKVIINYFLPVLSNSLVCRLLIASFLCSAGPLIIEVKLCQGFLLIME